MSTYWAKALLTILIVSCAGMVVFSQSLTSLFPVLPLVTLCMVSLAVVSVVYVNPATTWQARAAVYLVPILLGVFVRLYIYLFTPSYFVGDPDTYGGVIVQLIQTGHSSSMGTWYHQMPLFHILAGMVQQITAFDVKLAIGVYPLMIGILPPLVATKLAIEFVDRNRLVAGLVAGIITAVATNSLWLSYAPIAQSHTLLLFMPLFIIFFKYQFKLGLSATVVMLLILGAMVYSHKISLFLVLALLVPVVLLYFIPNGIRKRFFSENEWQQSPDMVLLLAIPAVFMWVQWVFTSNTWNLLLIQFRPDRPSEVELLESAPEFATAASVELPLLGAEGARFLVESGFTFVFLAVAGVAWLFLVSNQVRGIGSANEVFVLVLNAVGALMIIVVGLSRFVGQSRFLFVFGPLFAMSIGVFVARLSDDQKTSFYRYLVGIVAISVVCGIVFGIIAVRGRTTSLVNLLIGVSLGLAVLVLALVVLHPGLRTRAPSLHAVLVVVLVGGLLFSSTAIPDFAGTSRQYLTVQECEAQSFAYSHLREDVFTDLYYGHEECPEVLRTIDRSRGPNFRALTTELLSRDPSIATRDRILFREEWNRIVETPSGQWRLAWRPEPVLDAQLSKTYSSGEVGLYVR